MLNKELASRDRRWSVLISKTAEDKNVDRPFGIVLINLKRAQMPKAAAHPCAFVDVCVLF
jgi:hypothetical protein